MQLFNPFPKRPELQVFRTSLKLKTRLEQQPRFIHSGNVSEFAVEDGKIKYFRERLPRGGGESVKVDVFYRNAEEKAEKHSLELRNIGGGGFGFGGDLIDSIRNKNENVEIELWGYPDKKERGIFVLTVGVIRAA